MGSLSIIMPCLNEEKNVESALQETLTALVRYGIEAEVIVVNDGSTDRTRDCVFRVMEQDQRIRLIEHEKPQGIGASFWQGVWESKNEFVTIFPGDNENNPDETLAYFDLVRDVDIVVPFIHNIEIRSRLRRLISSCYRFIINISFGTGLNYMNGTVIYNSALLREIKHYSTGFFYQTEILIRLIRAGYLYVEVPHFLQHRSFGKTKALSFYSLWNVTKGYLRLMWDVHILRKFGGANLRIHENSSTYRRQCKNLNETYAKIQ